MKNSIKIISLFFALYAFQPNVFADILEHRYTIQTPLDSTQIYTIAPVGDYNADGHGDLALGILGEYSNLYSAVFLYYGGPNFDDLADLIFYGLPQDTIICSGAEDSHTGYGSSIIGLGDYNGDGYDDFAVGSQGLCYNLQRNGAVYIYFGSPNPDTTADIFITGEASWDVFGSILVNGNFNGDAYNDFLTPTYSFWFGQKVYIFLGSDPANGQYDWKRDYSDLEIRISNFQGGSDINNDGYDDFSWNFNDIFNNTSGTMLFFGGDPVDTLPYAAIIDTFFYLKDDISLDGVDDFLISAFDIPPRLDYLCLGGDPFNTVPDYGIPTYLNTRTAFVYNLPNGDRKFVMDNGLNRRLIFYNTGIPFDTTNYEFYYYGLQLGLGPYNIGDIDGSNGEEIAVTDYDLQFVNIYSGDQTGIDDNVGDLVLPENHDLISVYPNPFNSTCKITITDPAIANINIYDITGRLVERLNVASGSAMWNAAGRPTGVYFVKAGNNSHTITVKLVFLK